MSRAVVLVVLAMTPLALAQAPAFQWIEQIDASGTDSAAGVGVDLAGNMYIAGSTYSAAFPVKSAVQNHLASAGLFRIDGPGAAYTPLALTSATWVVADPQNSNTLYVSVTGKVFRSADQGARFSPLTLPRSYVFAFAVNPANDQILYAGTVDLGVLKSTDGGATWTSSNGGLKVGSQGLEFLGIWIDPSNPNILLANTNSNLVRSADAGATWQIVYSHSIANVAFNTANPGELYVATYQVETVLKSGDHGQTFSTITTPINFAAVLPDPNHPGRLLASSLGGVYESDDDGAAWTSPKVNLPGLLNQQIFVADWADGFLYTALAYGVIERISSDLQSVVPIGPPAVAPVTGIAISNGHVYVATQASRDVYVTKLDPSGNLVYSTYFGGSADDAATALAVDASGNVYVTGTTTSADFPVTKGAFATSGQSFLFRLNPDGSVGYSTYFAPPGTVPAAIAVDGGDSAYLAGSSSGNLPVTPGALQTSCDCPDIPTLFLTLLGQSGFVSKFDPKGATLQYSTYIGGMTQINDGITAFALAPDGTVYVANPTRIAHINASGSALLATIPSPINVQAMTIGPDGSVYVAGTPGNGVAQFQTTPGSFQPTVGGSSAGLTAFARWDGQLAHLLAATYFGAYAKQIFTMTVDARGDVYFGGGTLSKGLPTRTPLQGGFAVNTGFLSELSGDLSSLLFSSYFGDTDPFSVRGVAIAPDGSVALDGTTGLAGNDTVPTNLWANRLTLAPPPPLRIDAVEDATTLLDGPISAGETIVIQGAGFASDSKVLIGGIAATPASITPTAITATVPAGIPAIAAFVEVQSGGAVSNQVLVPVAP